VSCRNAFIEKGSVNLSKATALSFSSSGHSFAVASGATIFIYRTLSQEVIGRLKGHMSAVTAIRWAADDRTLVSASAGGAVYFWDTATCQRLRDREFVDKSCNFQGLHISANGQRGAARSTDGIVHLIQDGVSTHHVAAPPGFALPIAVTPAEHFLLATTSTGDLLSWPWPTKLPAPSYFQRCSSTPAHGAAIRHVCFAGMGTLVVTAADDGIMMVWSLQVCAALAGVFMACVTTSAKMRCNCVCTTAGDCATSCSR
jgi:WD40 repeat protein